MGRQRRAYSAVPSRSHRRGRVAAVGALVFVTSFGWLRDSSAQALQGASPPAESQTASAPIPANAPTREAVLATAAEAARGRVAVHLMPTRIHAAAGLLDRPALAIRAQEVDASLREALRETVDTGTTSCADKLDGLQRTGQVDEVVQDLALLECASNAWVIAPQIRTHADGLLLIRLAFIAPGSQRIVIRLVTSAPSAASAKAITAVRDELRSTAQALQQDRARASEPTGLGSQLRSAGRPVFAIAGGLFGAYCAFSVQRAAGSDDTRLLYPLLAVGTSVGVASALLASEEWDVTSGNAWFMVTSAVAGASIGIGLANGINERTIKERYAWGLGGSVVTIGVGTAALVKYKFDEGDAALVAGSALFGGFAGALGELVYRGTTNDKPQLGGAIGGAVGLLAGTFIATRVTVLPSRVVLVGTGAALGALAGAAAASPLVFDDLKPGRTRLFLLSTLSGLVAGGGISLYLTRARAPIATSAETTRSSTLREQSRRGPNMFPLLGPVASGPDSNPTAIAWGAGLLGRF
jgi:hypothetical protein